MYTVHMYITSCEFVHHLAAAQLHVHVQCVRTPYDIVYAEEQNVVHKVNYIFGLADALQHV